MRIFSYIIIALSVITIIFNATKIDFEKPFEFYYDFPGASLPTGSVLNEAIKTIFERITQDIFNESLAKW